MYSDSFGAGMSDTLDDKKSVHFPIIDTWKIKSPSVYIALPPDLINHVGYVTLGWGIFEKALNRLLFGVLATNAVTVKHNWQRFGLDQRCALLRDEAPVCFAENPDLLGRLMAVMDDIEPLQLQRNALVHGQITLMLSLEPAITADYEHRNKLVKLTLTEDQINTLYYEVIHLAGRMAQFAYPQMTPFAPPLSSQDMSRLQDVLSNSPPPQSIPSMFVGQRRSSGA